MTKFTIYNLFYPGHLHDVVRVVYFLIFLILTILQTYFSLQVEEQMAIDPKYPDTIPSAVDFIQEINS